METNKTNGSNPLEHTSRIKTELEQLKDHLRQDISKVNDPRAKALFEVSAEVLEGLYKAFTDYEAKNEEA